MSLASHCLLGRVTRVVNSLSRIKQVLHLVGGYLPIHFRIGAVYSRAKFGNEPHRRSVQSDKLGRSECD
jgi:hypothetical protein